MEQQLREYLGSCEVETSESHFGACDALICRGPAYSSCASEDCTNHICERHCEICPACSLTFCSSRDVGLHGCLYLHQTSGQCERSLIAPVLAQLKKKLAMLSHAALREFVNPLPKEIPADFAMAHLCLSGSIEDVPLFARLEQKDIQRQRRTARQREARACRRLRLTITVTRAPYHRVDLYKRSTVLIASGALLTRVFSGSPHYAEQSELLSLIGIYKQEDYVRDRLNALKNARPQLYNLLLRQAESIAQRYSGKTYNRQRSLFS